MVNLVSTTNVATAGVSVALTRNGTYIGGGTASGNKSSAIGTGLTAQPYIIGTTSSVYLDSPATTSACTYQVKIIVQSGYTAYVGSSGSETDLPYVGRFPSSITVMEVSGT
jgi:hypothetical protein